MLDLSVYKGKIWIQHYTGTKSVIFLFPPKRTRKPGILNTFIPYQESFGQVHSNQLEHKQKLNYMNSAWPTVRSTMYTYIKYFSFCFFL